LGNLGFSKGNADAREEVGIGVLLWRPAQGGGGADRIWIEPEAALREEDERWAWVPINRTAQGGGGAGPYLV